MRCDCTQKLHSDALKSLRAMVVGVREEFFKNLEAGDGKTAADGDEGSPSPFGTQSEDGDDPFAGVPYARFDDSGNAQVRVCVLNTSA